MAGAVREHADRNFDKPLEVFSFSRDLDEYCGGGFIFHGADLYQRLVFQPDVTGTRKTCKELEVSLEAGHIDQFEK